MAAIHLSKDNFENEVLQKKGTVLVDFWAEWCAPCRRLSPIVDKVAEEAEGITVGKVNVDEERQLAEKYSIMSIPTLVVFKDGKEVTRSSGVISEKAIMDLLK